MDLIKIVNNHSQSVYVEKIKKQEIEEQKKDFKLSIIIGASASFVITVLIAAINIYLLSAA